MVSGCVQLGGSHRGVPEGGGGGGGNALGDPYK